MQEGAAYIQVVMGVAVQPLGRQQIGNQSQNGNDQHRNRLHLFRSDQSLASFIEDADRHQKDRQAVDQGSQHLCPVQAVRVPLGGGLGRQLDRPQREQQGKQIQKDM